MSKFYDRTYFDSINTMDKAYWLGFIAADGCISDKGKVVLSSNDIEHIVKFKNAVSSEHTISSNGRFNQLGITAHEWKSPFATFGIVPRKTYTHMHIPDLGILTKDYIRGYFDGDGSIFKSGKKWYAQFTSWSPSILEDISAWITRHGIKPQTIIKTTAYNLRICGNINVKAFVKLLYSNVPVPICLDRKRKLALDCIADANSRISTKLSKYAGVRPDRGKFKAIIKFNKKPHYLGWFDTEKQAAQAYNAFIIKQGIDRRLNEI